jgi:hypothetical protein
MLACLGLNRIFSAGRGLEVVSMLFAAVWRIRQIGEYRAGLPPRAK